MSDLRITISKSPASDHRRYFLRARTVRIRIFENVSSVHLYFFAASVNGIHNYVIYNSMARVLNEVDVRVIYACSPLSAVLVGITALLHIYRLWALISNSMIRFKTEKYESYKVSRFCCNFLGVKSNTAGPPAISRSHGKHPSVGLLQSC